MIEQTVEVSADKGKDLLSAFPARFKKALAPKPVAADDNPGGDAGEDSDENKTEDNTEDTVDGGPEKAHTKPATALHTKGS